MHNINHQTEISSGGRGTPIFLAQIKVWRGEKGVTEAVIGTWVGVPHGVYAPSRLTNRLVTSRGSSLGSSRVVSSTSHVASASSAGA